MWSRQQLKQNAKMVLKANYWQCFFAAFILALFGGGGGTAASRSGVGAGTVTSGNIAPAEFFPVILTILASTFFISVIIFLIETFAVSPLRMGVDRFFLETTQYRFTLGEVLCAFQSKHYMNIVGTLFLRNLYQFLWTLLIIPGIIKMYSYRMTSFLLAENPSLSPNRAITLSRALADGHKWEMFLLDLSFLGWSILCMFTFGIGFFFLQPYIQATQAQLYVALRAIALDRGILDLSELES